VLQAHVVSYAPGRAPSGSAALLAQEQAEDVALLVSERSEAGRGALDPLPVVGGQVVLVIPAMPGGRLAARGVRRRPVPARGGSHFPEPFTHIFKVPAYRALR